MVVVAASVAVIVVLAFTRHRDSVRGHKIGSVTLQCTKPQEQNKNKNSSLEYLKQTVHPRQRNTSKISVTYA